MVCPLFGGPPETKRSGPATCSCCQNPHRNRKRWSFFPAQCKKPGLGDLVHCHPRIPATMATHGLHHTGELHRGWMQSRWQVSADGDRVSAADPGRSLATGRQGARTDDEVEHDRPGGFCPRGRLRRVHLKAPIRWAARCTRAAARARLSDKTHLWLHGGRSYRLRPAAVSFAPPPISPARSAPP